MGLLEVPPPPPPPPPPPASVELEVGCNVGALDGLDVGKPKHSQGVGERVGCIIVGDVVGY